jgi:hypothetical protein
VPILLKAIYEEMDILLQKMERERERERERD